MKKRSRELSIFSMSALDLFASALGAFILITIVLLPFFPNLNMSGQAKAELEQAQAELAQAKAELAQAEAELEQTKAKSEREQAKLEREKAKLKQEKAKLEQAKAKSEREKAKLERASAQAPKAKGQLEKRVEALQQEIDDTTVLLGIKTKAKKFVFVIDMSGSIYQPKQQDYRQFITLSIQDMLAAFKSEIEVCLLGFQGSNQLHYWPQNRDYFQVKKNTRDRVVGQVKDWMRLVDGGTPTRAALLAAIALDPEEIILLSDGAPSEDWRMVVRAVTAENRRKIPIHAVAVGNYVADRKFIDFLVQLTERNNGYVVGAKPG
ncbi:MAG: hypothetical protein OXE49_14285 [Gemmatimonadetes bacterium]|nr:hypothetical protein [Gemmatimonadota bacterium]